MLNIFYLIFFTFLLWGDNFQLNESPVEKDKILFVVSNADYYEGTDIPTSNHFAELVYPYDVLIKANYEIDFVSPMGGAVPLGYFNTSDTLIKDYIYDCTFMNKLATTFRPDEVDPDRYSAIYYGGGGAAMFGITDNEALHKIAMHIFERNNGLIAALCHGSYGIANLKLKNGKYLVEGKSINGFPDIFENKEAPYFQTFSHSVEGLLNKRGAQFKFSENGWDGFFQVDGRVITGQDPTSARHVAEQIIKKLNH